LSGIIVGLDIGTSYIRVVIGEVNAENNVEIIGVAKKPSQGLRNGVIVNIDAAMTSIKETIEAAEQIAGVEVSAVYTAIGGAQAESLNSKGQIGVDQSGRGRSLEINENAKNRAIEAAKAVVIPLDKKLIHVIPQEYIIDGLTGYKNPVGMMGVRLEVQVHIVTASITAYSNIQQCIGRAGYLLNGVIMLKTLAASCATVHDDEMDLGSILIDLGGGTTDVMVLNKGAPVFTTSIPVGGNLVTNDIAIVKGISNSTAERIKLESGCCWNTGSEADEEVIIPGVGGRPPEQTTRYELCQIIQPRMDEIFSMVKREVVRRANLTKLSGSIVLTGGGALMPGVVELAQSVFGTTAVRIGESADLGGVDKSYRNADFATVVGLVVANKDKTEENHGRAKNAKHDENAEKGKTGFFAQLKSKFF
jgi:cell division protein FtsA